MLPRRKLSEILVQARLDARVCNIIVEGFSDQVILRAFLEKESLPVLIYPIPNIEMDSVDPRGHGGNKARVIRISEYLNGIAAARILCVVDKDFLQFSGFKLNGRCLVTDLACLELYSFEREDFRGFIGRAYYIDFSEAALDSILGVSRTASLVGWIKDQRIESRGLAPLERSLSLENGLIQLDLPDWLTRSGNSAADQAVWTSIKEEIDVRSLDFPVDHRTLINVHLLDQIFRFWLRSLKGVTLNENWVVEYLRGRAEHHRLARYDFFRAIIMACEAQLALQ
jgi:hypothetical protein